MFSLVERIMQWAENGYTEPAVIYKNEILDYVKLAQKIKIASVALRKYGVKKDSCVLLEAITNPYMIVAYLAIQYCGGIVVFIDTNTTDRSINDIYNKTEAVLFLTERSEKNIGWTSCVMSIKALCNAEIDVSNLQYNVCEEEDVAEILFTTGTTGKPKGVVHTYRSINNILLNTIAGVGMRSDDKILLPLPLGHSLALRVLRGALYLGGSIVLQNGFAFINDIEHNQNKFSCTAMIAVPAVMEMLYRKFGEKFSQILGRFRYIEVGAGSLSVEQRKKYSKLLPDTIIYNTWGSSETGGVIFLNISEALQSAGRLGTLGKPLSDICVRVVDSGGKEIDSNSDNWGYMSLKGDMIMQEYWKDPDLTKNTINDGWIITNDIVYQDEEGYLYMMGRADDIVKVGGENVSTTEIENIVDQFDNILECACIGVDDSILGQSVVLFLVITSPNLDQKKLYDFLCNSIEQYKVPNSFVLLNRIPRNRMGKIDRKKLKTIWNGLQKGDTINQYGEVIKTYSEVVF